MQLMNKHAYWETMPTKEFLADCDKDGLVISPEKYFKRFKSEDQTPLPEGYEWASIDMKDPE